MPSFRYSHTVGFYAQSGRGFNNPVDVALGRNGKMFVADRADSDVQVRMPYKRITVCSVDEEYFGRFSTGGTGDGQILWPVSIAVDEDENVYVLDEALNRVTVFDSDWSFVRKWGTEGSGDGEFSRPAGMAFDPDGNLVLADALNNRVQRYTAAGQFLGSFGEAGTGDGQFNFPWGVAVDGRGNVYVADWRNDRIQKFDPMGGHLAHLGRARYRGRGVPEAVGRGGGRRWSSVRHGLGQRASSGPRSRRRVLGQDPRRVGRLEVGDGLLHHQPGRAGGAAQG